MVVRVGINNFTSNKGSMALAVRGYMELISANNSSGENAGDFLNNGLTVASWRRSLIASPP
jgi:hypothetical protein